MVRKMLAVVPERVSIVQIVGAKVFMLHKYFKTGKEKCVKNGHFLLYQNASAANSLKLAPDQCLKISSYHESLCIVVLSQTS